MSDNWGKPLKMGRKDFEEEDILREQQSCQITQTQFGLEQYKKLFLHFVGDAGRFPSLPEFSLACVVYSVH